MKLLIVGTGCFAPEDICGQYGITATYTVPAAHSAQDVIRAEQPEFCIIGEQYILSDPQLFDLFPALKISVAVYGTASDLELIRHAMQTGVVDYLPSSPTVQDITELLPRLIARRQHMEYTSLIAARLEYGTPILREYFWNTVLSGKFSSLPAQLKQTASKCGVTVPARILPLSIRWRDHGVGLHNVEAAIISHLQSSFGSIFQVIDTLSMTPFHMLALFSCTDVERAFEQGKNCCQIFLSRCNDAGLELLCVLDDISNIQQLPERVARLNCFAQAQIYLDGRLLTGTAQSVSAAPPMAPIASHYLTLLNGRLYKAAREELRAFFQAPEALRTLDKTFLANFSYQLLEGLKNVSVVRKNHLNILSEIPQNVQNTASNSVADFLVLFDIIIMRLDEYHHGLNVRKNLAKELETYILDHLSDGLTREVVSKAFFLSADHLDRVFKSSRGVSITAFINQQRMLLAAQLLQNPRLLISDIAIQTGFGSLSHFSVWFKHCTGYTPTQYRQFINIESKI